MAMGAPRQFPYTLEETKERFEHYLDEVNAGSIKYPQIKDFFFRNNISMDDASAVVKSPVGTNKALSEYIKRIIEWHFITLFSHPDWLKKPVLAIYLSKQSVCGYCYTDKQEVKQDTKMDVNVSFGGKKKVNNAFD